MCYNKQVQVDNAHINCYHHLDKLSHPHHSLYPIKTNQTNPNHIITVFIIIVLVLAPTRSK